MNPFNHLPLRLLSALFALRVGDSLAGRLLSGSADDSLSERIFDLLGIAGLAEWLYGWILLLGAGPVATSYVELGWCFFGPFATGLSGTVARKQATEDRFGAMIGRELAIAVAVGAIWLMIVPIWPLVAYVYLVVFSDPSRVPDHSKVDAQGIAEIHAESWSVVAMILVSAVASALWKAF